ncbi:lipase maturation factor family protein [Fodinibius halophilus]|uniref:Lipase maturation factor family protein n=1 Tax=Fodinibius halophilus TaxID=1736908 RepID=A0A6M1T5P7_9BACT|nr:lipase maturation factor family protein [Fodinibius halophilus]NGP87973.1 lipase maturation factor family protein [Fodinibius halophilus]
MLEGVYQSKYWLSRLIIQRGIGLMYVIAFVVAINQFRPLLGENGLLPVPSFIERISFKRSPSIFHWHYSDTFFAIIAWIGLGLSLLAVTGISDSSPIWLSVSVWLLLWGLYLSIVNVGQLFYGFGWESLLLEASFYAIFLGPLHYQTPFLMILMIRWLLLRVEFGAGLIKMRGDKCWRKLTCLNYHHETQPMPNPLSRFFHLLPESYHKIETLFNHIVQLGAVWLLFLPQPFASIGAGMIILSQGYLILSGNYAWLNWMTLILAFSGISDSYLQYLFPLQIPQSIVTPTYFQLIIIGLAIIVAYMSIAPIKNMISPHQRMNASFNPLHLVNTYGAFGTVTKARYEIIIEGTTETNITHDTEWKEYKFKGKPGAPRKMPSQFAPYHLRLDWQIWFAAMSSLKSNPWLIRLIIKLLQNDQLTTKLLAHNPFDKRPPTYIRARLFKYEFTNHEEFKNDHRWWKREFERTYMPPRSLNQLQVFKL